MMKKILSIALSILILFCFIGFGGCQQQETQIKVFCNRSCKGLIGYDEDKQNISSLINAIDNIIDVKMSVVYSSTYSSNSHIHCLVIYKE